MKFHFRSGVVAAITCLALSLPTAWAQPSSTTVLPAVDLSPGPDAVAPATFVLNRLNHKLYAIGRVNGSPVLKIVDTVKNTVTGGLSITAYPGATQIHGLAFAVDESAGQNGNKLYALLRIGSAYVVRVIDSATDTELTGKGTDIVLPLPPPSSGPEIFQMVVNPTTHKLYISSFGGQVVVVDGPARKVLATLQPNAGSFLTVDPAASRIFVLGENGGAIIDGATEAVTAPPEPLLFVPTAAAFNKADNVTYLTGYERGPINRYGVYALNGSGLLLRSNNMAELYGVGGSIALVPDENTVYVGAFDKVYAFRTTDLAVVGELAVPGGPVTCDPTGSGVLISSGGEEPNAIRLIDRASTAISYLRTAYRPHKLAVNRRTNRIYVLDAEANELVVIDGANRSIIARVPTPRSRSANHGTRDIAVSERLNRVYIISKRYVPPRPPAPPPSEPQMLDVYDGETNQLRSSRELNYYATALAVDDTRRRIYASGARETARYVFDWPLDVYDADTEDFVTSVSTGATHVLSMGSGVVAVNPITGRIYQAAARALLRVVDGNTLAVLPTSVETAITPAAMVLNFRANELNLVDRNSVARVDTLADRPLDSFAAGGAHDVRDSGLVGIAVDEEADTISVTNTSWNGERYVNRLLTYAARNGHALLNEVEFASRPTGVTFNPIARQFLVPHQEDGTISVIQAAGTAARDQFGNLSTRLRVGGNDDVMIAGFIVEGPVGSTKKVIVRGVGPSMEALGVQGALADTTLELHTAGGVVITNDNWKINGATGGSQQALMEASGLAPGHDLEAAIIADLPPGAHTAVIRGKDGAVGVGLAEVFVLDPDSPAQLANIATRGRVETGENVMIGGLIVSGPTASRALVRAIGPSLQDRLQGVLEDPVLELYDINGGLIATNDDWKSAHEADIAATTIAPTDDRESAILATLHPGNYTAIVRGKDESSGVAIVEAYRLP